MTRVRTETLYHRLDHTKHEISMKINPAWGFVSIPQVWASAEPFQRMGAECNDRFEGGRGLVCISALSSLTFPQRAWKDGAPFVYV